MPLYTGSGTSCSNIRQLETSLNREWQQLSQQDIRRLTVGIRRRVEAAIQARGGCTRYWTLNNRCHQMIHKWRFESEMKTLSCFLNCQGQYLKWTCFTTKTVLVILWLTKGSVDWACVAHLSFCFEETEYRTFHRCIPPSCGSFG
jgi:hypothetical protein